MQESETTYVRPASGCGASPDEAAERFYDAMLALAPSDEPPLVVGRRSVADIVADILVASEDMSS